MNATAEPCVNFYLFPRSLAVWGELIRACDKRQACKETTVGRNMWRGREIPEEVKGGKSWKQERAFCFQWRETGWAFSGIAINFPHFESDQDGGVISLSALLHSFSAPVTEEHAWAIIYQVTTEKRVLITSSLPGNIHPAQTSQNIRFARVVHCGWNRGHKKSIYETDKNHHKWNGIIYWVRKYSFSQAKWKSAANLLLYKDLLLTNCGTVSKSTFESGPQKVNSLFSKVL